MTDSSGSKEVQLAARTLLNSGRGNNGALWILAPAFSRKEVDAVADCKGDFH